MPHFIDRFLNIRGVIKDIYMQISELRVFNRNRSESLGKHPRESYKQWLLRSKDPSMSTGEYDRDDYIAEAGGTDKMEDEIEQVLFHLRYIYGDLLSILECDGPSYYDEDLNTPDDPSENILHVLKPRVDLHRLDMKMARDKRLREIVEQIYNVIYHENTDNLHLRFFHLEDTDKMFLILRSNRLSNAERTDAEKKVLEEWSSNYRMQYFSKA